MKKISPIIKLGLYSFLLYGECFFYSCSHDRSDCSKYEITQQESAFVSEYNKGDIAVFNNDTTSLFDTLHVTDKNFTTQSYSAPCNKTVSVAINVLVTFSHLYGCNVGMAHNKTPEIIYGSQYDFQLNGSLQSMTINGTTYNDVFVTSIDSTTIAISDRNELPWKINYSKSKGFIRFYMVNGQTWSKL